MWRSCINQTLSQAMFYVEMKIRRVLVVHGVALSIIGGVIGMLLGVVESSMAAWLGD